MVEKKDFWLIDPNSVGVIRFLQYQEQLDKSNDYMIIEEGIIMGIDGEEPPLMQVRKKITIQNARQKWKKLISEDWQVTNPKW